MNKVLTDLSFTEWIRYIFDHPVTEPAWYWDADANCAELEPQHVITHATKLFQNSVELLTPLH